MLGAELWGAQRAILRAVQHAVARRDVRGVAVRSGNQVGKTYVAALTVICHAVLVRDSITVTTAPTWKLVRDQLWGELRARLSTARLPLPAPGKTHWGISDRWYATGLSALHPEDVQGYHAPSVLVVVDEASRVRPEMFEGLERTGGVHLLIGNPTSNVGRFAEACRSSDWRSLHVSALDSPNVRAGRVVIPGLATAEWVSEMLRRHGADHPHYQVAVLGEFAEVQEDVILPLAWIDAAMRRSAPESDGREVVELGVDVAWLHGDASVIAEKVGSRVVRIDARHGEDTQQTGARVAARLRELRAERRQARAKVDAIGLGLGVVDFLRANGFAEQTVPVNVSLPAQVHPELYDNLKAELWDHWLRGALDPAGEAPLALPDDAELREELAVHHRRYARQAGPRAGKMLVEDKAEVRRELGRSPDRADALVLAVAPSDRPRPPIWVL